MLHWLAGAKPPEGSPDPDATSYLEPPETPAPVFAVRAFKHAIFGTPQTVQPKPRRHSNTENGRTRNSASRPERPNMIRPKSASDARAIELNGNLPAPEPMNSPTKGILMTPGTAGAKRKTVTFGDHVEDNDGKKPTKSGLPDDCPGKFPSPWVNNTSKKDDDKESQGQRKGRSKLTEALELAREESAKKRRGEKKEQPETTKAQGDEPENDCCRSWKTQYDTYRENSQREIKKLISKQKLAKSFAKDKDFQCTELADQLRQEKRSAERLEKRTEELEAQLKAMEQQVAALNSTRGQTAQATASVQTEPASRRDRPSPPYLASPGTEDNRPESPGKAKSLAERKEPVKEPQIQVAQPHKDPPTNSESSKAKTKSRPENIRTRTKDDIWNQSFKSSSPVLPKSAVDRPEDKPVTSPRSARVITSGTDLTPLMSLSVNTLPPAKLTRRDSAQPSPPDDRFAKEPLIRQEVTRPPQSESQRDAPKSPTQRKVETTQDNSIQVPPSSPFVNSPVLSPQAKASCLEGKEQSQAGAKENVSPVEKVKPMAAWNAINAPAAGKRVTSLTDKKGQEVGLDRLEAARARLAARGRNVS